MKHELVKTSSGSALKTGENGGITSKADETRSSKTRKKPKIVGTSSSNGVSQDFASKVNEKGNEDSATEGAETSEEARAEVRKRAKIRARVPPVLRAIDLSEPAKPPPGMCNIFNVSEIIKDFLFIGAGFDINKRAVTNLPADDDSSLLSERLSWFQSKNIQYALNMAGSPLQKEIAGLTYPNEDSIKKLALDVNDIDDWTGDMSDQFDRGADFIQAAFEEHMQFKSKPKTAIKPPAIFVHCVAGLNRSPFVVVWWLAKFHSIPVEKAWEIVRKRRDVGVCWADKTLGGPVLLPDEVLPESSEKKPCSKQRWFEEAQKRFAK